MKKYLLILIPAIIIFFSGLRSFGQCPPTLTLIPRGSNVDITGDNTIGFSVDLCPGQAAEMDATPGAGVSFQWYQNGILNTDSTENHFWAKEIGTYYLIISGCVQPSVTVTVTHKVQPEFTITSNPTPPHICAQQSIELTVHPIPPNANWVWIEPVSVFGTNTNPLVPPVLTSSTNFVLVGTHPTSSCTNSASLTVTVDDIINGGSIQANQTICAGTSPATLTSVTLPSGGGGPGTYSYFWSYSQAGPLGPWNIIPGADQINYSPGNLFIDTWFSRSATSPPCSAGGSNVVKITVNEAPLVTSDNYKFICSGSNVSYHPTSNLTGTTFTWTAVIQPGPAVNGVSLSGSGDITDLLSLNAGVTDAGHVIYTITPHGPGTTQCPGIPIDLLVTINPIPAVSTSDPPQTICSGGTTTQVNLTSAVWFATFDWYSTQPAGITPVVSGTTPSLPAQQFISTRIDPAYVTYHINVTGPPPTSCPGTEITYAVLVNPSPTVTNDPMSQDICSGETSAEVILESNVTGTDFNWTATAAPPSMSFTPTSGTLTIPATTITNPTSSQGIVTYHIIPSGNLGACPATPKDYLINVYPKPAISSSLIGNICSSAPYTYTITSDVAGSSFHWSRDPVVGIANGFHEEDGSTIYEILVNMTTGPIDVTYILTPTGPGPLFCPGTPSNLVVTVKPSPTVSAGLDKTINCGTSTILNGSATPGTGLIASISWSPAGQIEGPSNILTPVTKNLSSSQIFTLTVVDDGTCENSDNVQVNIIGTCMAVAPSASPQTICVGQTTHLNANASGGSGTYTYLWSSVPSGFSSNSPTPDANPTQTTAYTVEVNDGFSTTSGSVTVTVNPLPTPYQVTGGGEYCNGGIGVPINLNNSQLNVNYQLYRGISSEGPAIPGTGMTLNFGNYTTEGTYWVRASNTITGCEQDMTGNVIVTRNPVPTANAGPDKNIAYGTSTTLSGVASGGTPPYGYLWSPGSSIIPGQTGQPDPATTNLFVNTQFTFQVTDQKGCIATNDMWVFLNGDPLSVVTTAIPDVICNDGTTIQLNAAASGGSGSYTYSWTSNPAGFTSTIHNPTVNPTVNTDYFVEVGDGYNLVTSTSGVTVNPLPNIYDVLGGGSYCAGGSGVEISLSNSQTGINYQLYRGVLPYGPAIPGNGSAISFGFHTAAFNYTVVATNPTTACQSTMNGSVNVIILPPPTLFSVTGGGSYPEGGSGVPIGLNSSQPGVDYRLILGAVFITPPPGIPGDGNAITFGNQTQEGIYVVQGKNPLSGCEIEMQGSATVVINPLPTVFNVTGGGQRCFGQPGVDIGLSGSEIGVRYELLHNGDYAGFLLGNGNALLFGPIQTPGTYTINGVNISTGTTQMMNGNAVVTEYPLPVAYQILPNENACPDVEIYLNGSEAGINYVLSRGATVVMTVPGTGVPGLLSFGQHIIPGIYTILAVNPVTSCQALMTGATTIQAAPEIFVVNPPGIICPGTAVTLSSSETGIQYQLRRNDNINVGSPITGTGAGLDFGPQTLPGIYRVIAFNTTTNCYSWMDGSATIEIPPIVYSIIPNGETCSGASVRLNGSETGILYRLYLNGTVLLSTLTGDGQPLIFGNYYTSGIYTIIAVVPTTLCESLMDGQLTIFDSPSLFNILPNGISCAGTSIGLDDSEIGVNYTLFRDGWLIVAGPVPGTGNAIIFGIQNDPGNYTIEAVYATNTCSAIMNGSTDLYPQPTIFSLQPQGPQCAGTELSINGSEIGVSYELLRDGIVVQTLAGSGSVLHFGVQFPVGIYTVRGVNLMSDCEAVMAGTVTMLPLPLAFDITPAGANCSPAIIGLSGSESGITYQLMKDGGPSGTPQPGTGAPLSFGSQTVGSYEIQATNTVTSCTNTMTGTVIISPGPVVNALPDLSSCSDYPLTLQAEAFNYSSLLWSTSGDGTFSSLTILNPVYAPGTADLIAGTVTLTLTANGTPACTYASAAASFDVLFQSKPVSNAGADAVICSNETYALNGSAQFQSSVLWISSGDGLFDHVDILNPIYTPGTNDKINGTVNLSLSAAGISPCQHEAATDFMTLSISPLPMADAGSDASICENLNYQVSGNVTHAGSFLWSTSGDGGFDNPSLLNPIYTPGTLDIQSGIVILTLTANGSAGCAAMTDIDAMTLQINHLPDVNAGTDATICENQAFTLNGFTQNYSSLIWSSSGDGIFSNPTNLNGTYAPGPADLLNGQVTITLLAYGQNSCILQSKSDQMLLNFHIMPQANAGTDILSCPNVGIPLNGSASNYSSVLWGTSGNGIFDQETILTPNYTPGSADIAAGFVILTLTVNGQMECLSQISSDAVRIDFRTPPTASISGPASVCQGKPVDLTFNLSGTAPWSIIYSDGTQNFPVTDIPASPYIKTVYPANTTTYSLVEVQDQYCTGTSATPPLTVIVLPNPVEYNMTVTNNGGYCEGGSGVVIGIENSQTGVNYQLLFEGTPTGFPLPGTGAALSFGLKTAPGNYSVRAVRASTLCQTLFQNTIQVVIYQKPAVDFSGDASCEGTPTQFHLSGPDITNITQWIWNFGDGIIETYNSPVEPLHLYPLADTYQVIVTATDINGCEKIQTHQVVVGQIPTALFSNSAPVCEGDMIWFTDHSYSPSNTYLTEWHWEYGDGHDTTIYFPGNPNVHHRYLNPGSYTVTLTVTSNQQCTSVKIRPISIDPSPIANFDYSNPCVNELISFNDLSQENGGSSITEWTWNFGDPGSGSNNISHLQNPSHLFSQVTDYEVRLVVTTANGCDSSAVKTITIKPKPQAVFTATAVCQGTATQFTDQSIANAGVITAWDWNFGDGSAHSHIQNPEHIYAISGNHMVTLTVTNTGGCTHSLSQQITVSQAPVAGFSNSISNCSGSAVSFSDLSFALHGYLYKWIWNFGDGVMQTIVFPDPQNTTHTYASPGSYQVVLSVQTSDSCWASSSHTVTVGASPLANFDFSGNNCNGSPVTFQDHSQPNGGTQIVAWSWNFGDPTSGINNTSSLTDPSHVYLQSGDYTVQLIITNVNNCKDTIEKTVVVNGIPTVAFSADTVCKGSVTHFTDLSTPNSGSILTWNWDFGDGTTSNEQNPLHTYPDAGLYTVTLNVGNSMNCQNDTTQYALVNVSPNSLFSYTGNCMNSVISFQDESSTATGSIYQWHWDFGDGDTSNLQNPEHSYANAGTFNVTLTVKNTMGCTDSIAVPVIIYQNPDADYSFFSTFCPAGRVTFTDHSIPSGVPVTGWLWFFENGSYSTSANPAYTFPVTDTIYQVKLIITDANGCTDTLVKDVYVNPGFRYTFLADSVCVGTTTHFQAQNLAPGDTLHDLRWNFGEPSSGTYNTSTLYSPDHLYTNPGNYIVKLSAYNINNCHDSIYREVVVYPGPIANFAFDTIPYCDTIAVFTNHSTGSGASVDSLIWQFGDGNMLIEVPPFLPTVSHPYAGFGDYTVSLTAINANGCRNTFARPILVSCITAAFAEADTLKCTRQQVSIIDSSAPVSLISNWQWFFGDGTDTTYQVFTPDLGHIFADSGHFEIMLVVTSTHNGVSIRDTSRQTVIVKPSPIAAFNAIPVCLGDTTRFINLSDSNGVSITSNLWKFREPSPDPGDTSTLINPVHFYPSPGKYLTLLTVANALGCADSIRKEVRVNRLPDADFSNSVACSRDHVFFTDESLAGDTLIDSWQWAFHDPLNPRDTVTVQDPVHTYASAGQYTVFLKIKDQTGCSDTITKSVDVLESPLSAFTIEENIDNMTGKIQLNNISENAVNYEWDFGNGSHSVQENPIVTYQTDGTYTIRLVSWALNNCSDTTIFDYEFMFHNLFVPNAFSPTNIIYKVRLFKPVGVNIQEYLVQVFDNWGHLMWQSTALDDEGRPLEGWDGTFNGELMPQASYLWKINATFKDGKKWEGSDTGTGAYGTIGNVNLIR